MGWVLRWSENLENSENPGFRLRLLGGCVKIWTIMKMNFWAYGKWGQVILVKASWLSGILRGGGRVLVCLCLSGAGICAGGCHFFHSPAVSAIAGMHPTTHAARVVDVQRLRRGGRLLIVPFSPGVNVSASDELERIALRTVQTMVAEFNPETSPFIILHAENAQTAELIMKGRVVQMKESRGLKLWGQRKRSRVLEISGRIVDPATNETILVFTYGRESEDPAVTWEDLAGLIGQDISKEIADQI
jgi:hypothetical protein